MITKDEITMYICSYALFLKEMLMFRCTVAKTATKYPYERKYSSTNEQFWDTFPWQDFFPDISLTVNIIPDMFQIPWHFQLFQTSGYPAEISERHCHLVMEDLHT